MEVRDDPDGLRVAALNHLTDNDELVHYAAVYGLARTAKESGESQKALEGLLTSSRVDDRLLAAGALIFHGDPAAIPVLIAEVGSPDAMAYRDPPQTASEFAARQLLRFTKEDFGLRAASDTAAAAQVKALWEEWWTERHAELVWDAAAGKFG
jgi:HEAT repeat protein